MKPIIKINGHDYTEYLAEDGLKPSKNDLDSDGSGRNLLDGLMYRSRIATKLKWTVTFNRMDAATLKALEDDLYADSNYVSVTLLEAGLNRYVTRSYYTSTITEGTQRYLGGETVYDGVTFNITER